MFRLLLVCAHEKIRTSTPVKALPPQDSVSTNSTTCAIGGTKVEIMCLDHNDYLYFKANIFEHDPLTYSYVPTHYL